MRLSNPFRAVPLVGLLAATGPAAPASAVVLVVAGWCAPCREEIAHREAIAVAAAPRVVRIVAIDDPKSTRAMMAGLPRWAIWTLSPAERLRFADAVFARSAGLPYAFATDANGKRCADFSGELDPVKARALVARCAP